MNQQKTVDDFIKRNYTPTKPVQVMSKTKNTQARWPSESQPTQWKSYGDVSHCEAARQHAKFFERDGVVETRWENEDGTINQITVVRDITYRAVCHRPAEYQ